MKAAVAKAIERRRDADRMIPDMYALLPLIGIFAALGLSALSAFAAWLGLVWLVVFGWALGALGWLVFGILVVVVEYWLISRRNSHFARVSEFRDSILRFVRDSASAKKAEKEISMELAALEGANSEAKYRETEKPAVLWLILTLVPGINLIAMLYVLYFLTSDFYQHSIREQTFLKHLQSSLKKLGVEMVEEPPRAIPERSFILYVILTIVTIGLFGIYWFYVLIKDPNGHFRAQWVFEDRLSKALGLPTTHAY